MIEKQQESHKNLTVYRASAGSGKTFTLAAEYIALLLCGYKAGSILAVTFTKKATAEMKERILKYLYALAIQPEAPEMQPFLNKVRSFMPADRRGLDAEGIRVMARKQLENVLGDYNHFTVTTIDAFLQRLLGEVARVAGLQTNYKVELNDHEVIDQVVDQMVAHIEEADGMTKARIRSLIRQKIEDEKGWDIRRQLKSLATQQLYNEVYLKEKGTIDDYIETDKMFKDYKEAIRSSNDAKAVLEMKRLVGKYDKTYVDKWVCGNKNQLKWLNGFVKRMRDSLADEVSNDDLYRGMGDSSVDYISDTKLLQTYEGPGTAEDIANLLMEMNELCAECRCYTMNMKYSTEHLGELGLLNSIAKEVDNSNREANRMLLSMTPILLQQILSKGTDTMFVLEKAGVRYSHIMIDEFQDTARLQWENFLPLVDEILSRGGTTLLVGDVKQSIYRFRGGDWDILKNIDTGKLARRFADGEGCIKPLTRNFRSDWNIVKFNMGFFPLAADELDKLSDTLPTWKKDVEWGSIRKIYEEEFDPSKMKNFCCGKEDSGYVDVRIYPVDNAKGAEESRKTEVVAQKLMGDMFDEIVSLRREGVRDEELMILVRGKKQMDDITSFLNANRQRDGYDELSIVSSDAFKLHYSVSVQLLVCVMRYLNNKDDKVALAYLALHYQNDILGGNLGWTDIMDDLERCLPAGFDRRELLSKPLYEMVEELKALFLYKDGRRTLQDDSYVFAFMDGLVAFLDDNASDLDLFLQYWDDTLCDRTIPVPSLGKGIRMMTIHKVKGLEATTVFIPFCDWNIEKDQRGGYGASNDNFIWCKPGVAPYDMVPLLPVSASKSLSETIYKDDYAWEHYRRRIDNLNLLYVAFTRAKKNLYVFSMYRCKTKDKKGNDKSTEPTIGDLITTVLGKNEEADKFDFGGSFLQAVKNGQYGKNSVHEARAGEEDRMADSSDEIVVEMDTHAGRMKFRQSNRSHDFIRPLEDEGESRRQEYIREGNLCHRIFSEIRTPDDAVSVLERFRNEGVIDSDEKEEALKNLVQRSMQHPEVKGWYDGSWTLFRECSILTRQQDGKILKRRPDRVMMRGGETVVVDFKFGVARPEHEEQVREYMSLLVRMGHEDVKGFLWYVYEESVVQVK